jgi:chorismate dehydratase
MSDKRRLRVGAVTYLNTKPLVHGLAEAADFLDVSYEVPSRLADRLVAGELDVGLIPSIEYLSHPHYRIVPDACIACRGPVLSVKLFSRVPMDRISTLALDEGSRTSVALVRILLKQRFGLFPQLQPLPLDADAGDSPADAVLLIGDRAIRPWRSDHPHVWDLGAEWCEFTGLPFVFAMWTARPDVPVARLEIALRQARDRGLSQLESIASQEAPRVGLTFEECLGYLRDNLYFHLGDQELRGLEKFRRLAVELGDRPLREPSARAGKNLHGCEIS